MGVGHGHPAGLGRRGHADRELPEGLQLGRPTLGFFAQRDRFKDAIANGEVLAPAKSMDDMNAVVTNSTVDGILAAFFAILIIVVIARRHAHQHQGHPQGRPCPRPRSPAEESQLYAPAGLFPTAEEREHERVGT